MTLFPYHLIQFYKQQSGLDTAKCYDTSVSQTEEQDCESTVKEWCNEYDFNEDTAAYKQIRQPERQSTSPGLHRPPQPASNDLQSFEHQYSLYINNVGASSDENKGQEGIPLPFSSFDLLKEDLTEFKSCNREQERVQDTGTGVSNTKLSTDQIMRMAGERFIEFTSYMFININTHMQPYSSNLAGITVDEKLDIELVQLLFTVAEKISQKQTDRACRLLSCCQKLASNTGTPVQRVVFYFAEALEKKIERETGRIVSNTGEKNQKDPTIFSKLKHHSAMLAWYQKLPFPQAMQFAGVQAMLEKMKMNSKVHLIDIQMRIGATWVIVMQALAKQKGYKVKQLKLTVIETIDKEAVEAACTHLQNFAKTLNLKFSYHIILLSNMKDLTENQFEVESDEIIVAYAPFVLRTMIARPLCLERLMNVMKRLNPSVMVITEVEANHNSPSFVNRFIESFFYLGAFFDCLEDSMESNDLDRLAIEGVIFRYGIHNIVATEGSERVTRSVKYEVWRAYLERFGMVEAELSDSCLYQAQFVLQTFPCVNSCSLEKKKKGLVVGWKGTPLCTLSAWRFS